MAWFRVPPLGVRAYIFINNSHLLLTTPINSDIILLYFQKGKQIMTFMENFILVIFMSPIVLGLAFVMLNWLVDELSVIGDMRAEDFGIFAVFMLVCAVIAWTMT